MANEKDNEESLVLGIFPNEVWCKILESVKAAPDYHSIISVTPFFRTILLPCASQILFPEVAKVLLMQLPSVWCIRPGKRLDSSIQCVVNALTLRHVNRASRNAVNEWLQAQDFHSTNTCMKSFGWKLVSGTLGKGRKRIFDKFQRAEHFVTFGRHFDSTHMAQEANPFMSRGIMLEIPNERRDGPAGLKPYETACAQLLRKYGNHVWYCRIYLSISDFRTFIGTLRTILGNMPNLRALLIQGFYPLEPTMTLEQNSATIPFPRLEQLHTIYVKDLCCQVIQAFLQSNPQVRQIHTCGSAHLAKLGLKLLPNLTAATFEFPHREQGTLKSVEIFNQARIVGRLERLSLNASEVLRVSWGSIFRAVESKFSDSLTQLELHLPRNIKGKAMSQGLTLLKLKTLKLVLKHSGSLDFILPLKNSLERLSILNDKRLDSNKHNGATFLFFLKDVLPPDGENMHNMFLGKPIQFSIWAHFPKLKHMEIQKFKWDGATTKHAFTREEWRACKVGPSNVAVC